MLTKVGAKLLDFGLGKAYKSGGPETLDSNSPTLSAIPTVRGYTLRQSGRAQMSKDSSKVPPPSYRGTFNG